MGRGQSRELSSESGKGEKMEESRGGSKALRAGDFHQDAPSLPRHPSTLPADLNLTLNGKLKPRMNGHGRQFSKSSIDQQLHPGDEQPKFYNCLIFRVLFVFIHVYSRFLG
jgi:hypothetical protein